MTEAAPDTAPFAGHTDPVLSVAFSPDGSLLASGGFSGIICLWSTASWEQVAELSGHTWPVAALAFSSDGRMLASASDRGGIRLWDLPARRQTARFNAQSRPISAIAWSRDGGALITAGADGMIRWWGDAPVPGQQNTERKMQHAPRLNVAAFDLSGETLAANTEDGGIRLWDTGTGQQAAWSRVHDGPVSALAWSQGGIALAIAASDGSIQLLDPSANRPINQFMTEPAVAGIACSPDGTVLVTGGNNSSIRLWDTATGQRIPRAIGHTGRAYAVTYSPDGDTLATGGTDGMVRFWDPATGRQTSKISAHTASVRAIAYRWDGSAFATGSDDCTARVWDSATGLEHAVLTGRVSSVNDVTFSPDGTVVAAGDSDRTVRLYDAMSGQGQAEFSVHNNPVAAVAFSPDGEVLASGAATVRIWDPVRERQVAHLTEHTHGIRGLAWNPDGSRLATRGAGVRVWDTGTWEQIARLTGHGGFGGPTAWSPDGATIISTSRDGTVRLWDTGAWQERLQLTGHTGVVRDLAWHPAGAALATVGDDGTIRIWDPRTGAQTVGTGFEPPESVRALAGVRSDSPSGEDRLGIGDDVETLAELIAATETSPPLAIALIGDWGAGKSSVMLQVERHINLLAERSRNHSGDSAFAANVRQVRFNAWHYSDDHLWTGLVRHLFTALAESPSDPGLRNVPEKSKELRAELDEMRAASREAADQAEKMRGPAITRLLTAPLLAGRVLRTAARQAFRDLPAAAPAITAWAVLGAAAYLAWIFLGQQIAGAATAIAALAPPVAVVAGKLKSARDVVESLAETERSVIDQRIAEKRNELAGIDGEFALERFVEDRGGADSYGEYRGLLGQVHDDLRELSGDLSRAREEWASGDKTGPPPLERIVLYIDDLDRCPPARVVKVLEAVHLMLALDLFVVVVAVDARWLIRSLEQHHHDLFRAADADGESVATPVDYLDKIFQIPFALCPPAPDAMARYLRSLLPDAPPADDPPFDEETPSDTPLDDPMLKGPDPLKSPGGDTRFPAPGGTPRADSHAQRLSLMGSSAFAPIPRAPIPATNELRPQGLQLSEPEIEFMARLGRLVPTPRAAKRLVNIYRLVRIGIPDAELPAFTGDASEADGPFRVVQILLAILVGHPKAARAIFSALLAPEAGDDLATTVGKQDDSFLLIKNELARLAAEQSLTVTAEECRRWCPLLARFSFHTRDLTANG